jgi:hypothetical protein
MTAEEKMKSGERKRHVGRGPGADETFKENFRL